jgi:hypothetical protein
MVRDAMLESNPNAADQGPSDADLRWFLRWVCRQVHLLRAAEVNEAAAVSPSNEPEASDPGRVRKAAALAERVARRRRVLTSLVATAREFDDVVLPRVGADADVPAAALAAPYLQFVLHDLYVREHASGRATAAIRSRRVRAFLDVGVEVTPGLRQLIDGADLSTFTTPNDEPARAAAGLIRKVTGIQVSVQKRLRAALRGWPAAPPRKSGHEDDVLRWKSDSPESLEAKILRNLGIVRMIVNADSDTLTVNRYGFHWAVLDGFAMSPRTLAAEMKTVRDLLQLRVSEEKEAAEAAKRTAERRDPWDVDLPPTPTCVFCGRIEAEHSRKFVQLRGAYRPMPFDPAYKPDGQPRSQGCDRHIDPRCRLCGGHGLVKALYRADEGLLDGATRACPCATGWRPQTESYRNENDELVVEERPPVKPKRKRRTAS